jgi:hypothetical protein
LRLCGELEPEDVRHRRALILGRTAAAAAAAGERRDRQSTWGASHVAHGTPPVRLQRVCSLGAEPAQTRNSFLGTLSTMTTETETGRKIATPWGVAALVEEVALPQKVGEKRFESLVQLLETKKGELLVRFAYATGGTARRGPVTLRAKDVERLRAALAERPALNGVLDLGGGA